jgi:hypothetical protein
MDVGNLLMKVSDNLSVRRAFGATYEKEGMLIIPVAVVAGGGGRVQDALATVTRPPVPIVCPMGARRCTRQFHSHP